MLNSYLHHFHSYNFSAICSIKWKNQSISKILSWNQCICNWERHVLLCNMPWTLCGLNNNILSAWMDGVCPSLIRFALENKAKNLLLKRAKQIVLCVLRSLNKGFCNFYREWFYPYSDELFREYTKNNVINWIKRC